MEQSLVDIISVLSNRVEDPVKWQVLLVDLQLGVTALHQVVKSLPFYFQSEHGLLNQDVQLRGLLDQVLCYLYQLGYTALVLGQLG